jgi:hypothetical protein
MSFFAPKVSIPTARSDSEDLHRSGYREADPVPLCCGYHRVGLKWICHPFGLKERKVENASPYAISSIAGVAVLGPALALGFLRIGGKPIALLNSSWNGSGYADTPITTWRDGAPGQDSFVRVYRGSETQDPDPLLVAQTGQDHPAYRGNCYAILFNVNWGSGATEIDNVELDVAVHPSAIGPWSQNPATWAFEGISVPAAIYFFGTHLRAGLSLAPNMSAAYWGQRAVDLETDGVAGRTGWQVGIHPIYGAAKDGAAILADLASYFDGFFTLEGDQLRCDWFPGGAAPTTGYTTLNEHDLVDAPTNDTPGRDTVPSSVVVIFRENDTFEQRPVSAPVPRSLASKADRTVYKIDRPFFAADTGSTTYEHVPAMVAHQLALEVSSPESALELQVHRAAAVRPGGAPLRPGDLCAFAYTPWGLTRLCRVKELVDDRAKESVQLVLVRERGTFPAPFVEQTDPRVVPVDDVPAEIAASSICPVYLPSGFGGGRRAAVLVERPSRAYAGARIWLAPAGPGAWQAVQEQRTWAVRTTTNAVYTSGAASIDVTLIPGLGTDIDQIQSVNATEQADDTLLAYFPATGEWASVGTVTPLGGGAYTLTLLRGRRGSAAAAGASGASCWLVHRAGIDDFTSAEFSLVYSGGAYDAATATKLIKVQPFSATQVGLAKPDAGVALLVPDIAAVTGLTAYPPSSYPPRVLKQIALGNNKYTTLIWDRATEPDLAHYEVRVCYGADPAAYFELARHAPADPMHQVSLAGNHAYGPTYAYVRKVDTAGNYSAWAATGSLGSSYGEANGDLLTQNESNTALSGVKHGAASASSVRKVVARYPFNHFVTLAGGANVENFAVDISNRGFSAKPDSGSVICIAGDMANVVACYDYDHASNSSTSAQIKVVRIDGGTITAGTYRFGGEFTEYD